MLAQTLHNPIGVAINVMVPEKSQEDADCFPKAQNITQKEKQSIVLGDLTVSDQQEKLETLTSQSSEKQVCDRAPDEDVIPEISQPCVNLAEAVSTELTSNVEDTLIDAIIDQEIAEEFAFLSPDPAFTLEVHASPRSDQGAQGSCSLPSSSVNPPNNSYTSLLNSPLFSDPFEYELEKLRREEVNLRKNFEETTSELLAELERKMAEARSEYDMKSKEIEVEYKAKTMEEEANKRLVAASSFLANAFVFKSTDKSNLPVDSTSSHKHSIQQQQQAVETNTTHMNSTAPPPPPPPNAPITNRSSQPSRISPQVLAKLTHLNSIASVVGTPVLDTSSPLFPRFNMTQPRPVSQQVVAKSNTAMTSTAPPRPSITSEEALPLHSPCFNTPQTRPPPPSSASAVSSPPVHSTVTSQTRPPSPSSASAASSPPVHSTVTPQTRPPPLIPNITPSSSSAASSVPVHGTVRMPQPRPSPLNPNITAAASSLPVHGTARTPQTRPPALTPNITPSSSSVASSPPVHGTVQTPQTRPPPLISKITPSSSSAVSSPPGDGTELMSQARPRPLIPNITPSSAPSPPVHGTVRRPAPHLQRFRPSQPPNTAGASTIHVRRLVEEQKQKQGNSNGDVVCLSDDDD